MSLAWCVLVAAAGGGALASETADSARAALEQGDLATAERRALDALAEDPRDGGALLVLGLTRFKQGRPADALEALDRAAAAAAPDAPDLALLEYDRGSCLTALGRPGEAEQAFLRAAARDPELAPVAEVSAGLAALDAGALDRAKAAADRAAAHPGPAGLTELIADLRAQISAAEGRAAADAAAEQADAAASEGMALFGAERYAEAVRSFLRAAELEPSAGMHHLMAGASAYHLGDSAAARAQLEQALGLELDPAAVAAAREYLAALTPGLRGRGEGFALRADLDTGMDSNALESGLGFFPELPGPRPPGDGLGSPFARALLGAAYRRGPSDALFGELTYALEQVAYASFLLREDSLQQHALAATLELTARPRLRFSLGAQGGALFIGLSQFRGVQWSAGGSAAAAFDEADWLTSRLRLDATGKKAFSSEFGEYSGARVDATLAQDFRWPRLSLTAWYRYREERIGTRLETDLPPLPPFLCPPEGCGGVSQVYVIPFAYRSSLLAAAAGALLPRRWRGTAELSVEWRSYLSDSSLQLQLPDGSTLEADRRRRQDLRFTASLAVWYPLGKGLELGGRYDLSLSSSNVNREAPGGACAAPDYSCHELDYGRQSFSKHVLSVSFSYTR
ncbi:MAG TPA: tetratricopeptide repeat protein [Myxococcales bacterium]|nr:tetratricopeptide repeat protein [Myxococcales bacterium]